MNATETKYCAKCYSAAEKAGRAVRMTDVCKRPICSLCESRIRNGLVHYVPSNGSEGEMFFSRCDRCRHFNAEGYSDPSAQACAWGIADKVLNMMANESDSPQAWHDPADLDHTTSPAICKRFTHKDDENGHFRDPPPPDCEGQMTFGELDVPKERVPQRVTELANK